MPKKYLLLSLILLATFALYYPAIFYEFTNWDDDIYVLDNPYLATFSAENLKSLVTEPINGNYNPLTMLTFAVEKHFFGENPLPFHLNNILLHLLNVALVFSLALLLRLPLMASALVALLFGIHPMHIESVAWITERKDVLYAFFYLLSLLCYVKYVQESRFKTLFYSLTIVFMLLSAFAKIQAVSLPLTLLAIDYYLKRTFSFKILVEKIPHFLIALCFGLLGIFFLNDTEYLRLASQNYSFFDRILFGIYGLAIYLLKAIFPLKMAAHYPYPTKINELLPMTFYIVPFVFAIAIFVLYKKREIAKKMLFGFAFFFVNLVFMFQILGAGEAFLADRFVYIAYFGLFFMMAQLYVYLIENHGDKKLFIHIGLSVFLFFLGLKSFQQLQTWQNSNTLWTNVIEQFPNEDYLAYNNRGNYFLKQKQTEKALADFNKAIAIQPNFQLPYINRGNIYFRKNENEKALADYAKALQFDPQNEEAYCNRGGIYVRQKKYDLAAQDFQKAISLAPLYADPYYNRGVMYSQRQEFELAIKDYNKYLNLKPNNVQVLNWRGIAYFNLKQSEKAVADFTKVIGLQPKNGEFYFNRATAYHSLGKTAEAEKDLEMAKNLGYKR